MLDYLNESYGGSETNMLENSAYYCYTIKDVETGKFYSGSRGVEGNNVHDLFTKYFTSSSVIDFKCKLKEHPDKFEYRIEYFKTRLMAFDAEKQFHKRHEVGKNTNFINSATAGGSNCGAGTVLCKGDNGKTYRVTVDEYSRGHHEHISKNMMNIRTEEGIKKIQTKDFNPDIHRTEFEDYVLAVDVTTGITKRIPSEQFNSNSNLVGITKGMVVAFDTETNSTVSISKEEFHNSNGRYVGNTYGMVPVIDRLTGEKKHIKKEDYNKDLYLHQNSNKITVYSLELKKNIKIDKDEYEKNKEIYANLATKVFYKVDGIFFVSKKALDKYYRETRGKTVLKVKQYEISSKFNDISVITKEEYEI